MKNFGEILLGARFKNDGKTRYVFNPIQIEAKNTYLSDIEKGLYDFEKYDCECGCKYQDLIPVSEKDGFGFECYTKICPKCGLMMTNPRMTQESYNKFYDEIYRKVYLGYEEPDEGIFNNRKKRGAIIYEYLEKNCDVTKIQNVLEIGCGDGGILAELVSRGMKHCKGIDLDSKFLNFGKAKGLDLEFCHSKDLLSRNEKYDLIILNHVLEHFVDIKSELAVIRQLLSDEGLLYVAVPGVKNVRPSGAYRGDWMNYFQTAHVRHFCKDTLSQVMSWNGFEKVSSDEEIKSIYKKSDVICNSKQCINYFSDVVKHLQSTENKYLSVRKYLDQEKNSEINSPMLTQVTFPFADDLGDTVLSYCVRRTFDNLNQKKFSYFLLHVRQPIDAGNVLDRINATKAVIVDGGGKFDSGEKVLPHIIDQQSTVLSDFEKISSPLIFYSVGYDYFKGHSSAEVSVENLNDIIEKSAFAGLRNTAGIRKVKAFLRDDLKEKIVFQPCTTTIIRKIIADLPKKTSTKKVAINATFDETTKKFGENKNIIFSQIANALKKIECSGYEIYFVQHRIGNSEFIQYLDKANVSYKNVDAVAWFPEECFEFYNEMDLVFGMNEYSQTIPFGLNTKIISLSPNDELKCFLEDTDSLDWLIELDENSQYLSEKIFDKFQEVQSDKNIYERLIEQQNKLYQITLRNHEQIKNILDL